jgi:hypothetical protein
MRVALGVRGVARDGTVSPEKIVLARCVCTVDMATGGIRGAT